MTAIGIEVATGGGNRFSRTHNPTLTSSQGRHTIQGYKFMVRGWRSLRLIVESRCPAFFFFPRELRSCSLFQTKNTNRSTGWDTTSWHDSVMSSMSKRLICVGGLIMTSYNLRVGFLWPPSSCVRYMLTEVSWRKERQTFYPPIRWHKEEHGIVSCYKKCFRRVTRHGSL